MLETIYKRSPIPIQTLFLNAKALELYLERYGGKFSKAYAEFAKSQWFSSADLESYQNEKLKRLISHAYNTVPYYHDLFARLKLCPADIQSRDDLRKLPVLTRDQVKANISRLLSAGYPKWLLRHGHTSGTTGSPLDIYYDINTCVVHHAVDWRFKSWAGLSFDEPYASLQGRMIVPLRQTRPPFWRYNYVNRQLFLSAFHLQESNIAYYFDELARRNIRYIEGYPSTIYILALYLQKKHEHFPLKAVFTSSETLYANQREDIERAFACRVFDSYGMAERVAFATECPSHTGAHLNLDYGITEFLDRNDEPVGPGQLGRIVATGLHNYAMPLIRFEMKDASCLRPDSCNCGRFFPLMESVTTKQESIVSLPDGRLISPSVLTHPFKPMHNIEESQIIQERPDELVVKIVRRADYTERDETMLLSAFKERLGDQITVRLDYVSAIPRTPNAKFRWVISKIPPRF
jgi:phenylacetate-CoA ligase